MFFHRAYRLRNHPKTNKSIPASTPSLITPEGKAPTCAGAQGCQLFPEKKSPTHLTTVTTVITFHRKERVLSPIRACVKRRTSFFTSFCRCAAALTVEAALELPMFFILTRPKSCLPIGSFLMAFLSDLSSFQSSSRLPD